MKRYLLKRILFSLFSLLVVTGTVMLLVYNLMDRSAILATDPNRNKYTGNSLVVHDYGLYEEYGYMNFTNYGSFVAAKYQEKYGDDYPEHEDYQNAIAILQDGEKYASHPDVVEFTTQYTSMGYEIQYLPRTESRRGAIDPAMLVAKREKNVFVRLGEYIANFFHIETVNDVQDKNLTDRYIRWEWDQRSNMPALVGSGTTHKYLIYFDNHFPFVHQNILQLNLGVSNKTFQGIDTYDVLMQGTGPIQQTEQEYPVDLGTGVTHLTSVDFHTMTYSERPAEYDATIYGEGEHYIGGTQTKSGLTRIVNSFLIGIIATVAAYIIGFPLGILMAQKKDKLVDKLGNAYIIFIMAVPSLAYIYIFAAIGTNAFGLPYNFNLAMNEKAPWILAAALPIISLALPSIGGLMKWMRRYMIDQKNSDYVKFARSQGLSEGEIFSKHISRNAFIYFVHSIPADILFALVGALITERVYQVPGVGGLLTNAITSNDNGVIVAGTVFYTFLSIVAMIAGDLLLAKYDPRVSFTSGRK